MKYFRMGAGPDPAGFRLGLGTGRNERDGEEFPVGTGSSLARFGLRFVCYFEGLFGSRTLLPLFHPHSATFDALSLCKKTVFMM